MSNQKYIKLNNGVEMPMAGIGTFLLTPDKAEASVISALQDGYELIDTANAYVNGSYRKNDAIGKLMYDFSCTNPDDMNYEALAGRARYFKKEKKGVEIMCKMLEDMRKEVAQTAEYNKAKKTAIRMIKAGKMPAEDIADYTELPLETVRELEQQIMQMA